MRIAGARNRLLFAILLGRMFEQDDRPVSRRQLFRGLAGSLGRALGEFASPGLELEQLVNQTARPKPEPQEFVLDPDRQESAMRELFGYLDDRKAQAEATAEAPTQSDSEPPAGPHP